MITTNNARAYDVNNGNPFPPFIFYANDYDRANGELPRVKTYLYNCNNALYQAVQAMSGLTFSNGQQVDAGSLPTSAQQQLGYAAAWLEGARTVLYGVPNPCSSAWNQTSFNNAIAAAMGVLNNMLTSFTDSQGVKRYTKLGDFTLDANNHPNASSWDGVLVDLQRYMQDLKDQAASSHCTTNTVGDPGAGGDPYGGIDFQPTAPNGSPQG